MISNALLNSLLMYFILALVFESAFSVIFNWSVFIKYFKDKGVKTVIMVVSAIIIFGVYDIDIITSVINEYKTEVSTEANNEKSKTPLPTNTPGGELVTAMFIAGGSKVVNRLLNTLKLRNDEERKSQVDQRIALATLEKGIDVIKVQEKEMIVLKETLVKESEELNSEQATLTTELTNFEETHKKFTKERSNPATPTTEFKRIDTDIANIKKKIENKTIELNDTKTAIENKTQVLASINDKLDQYHVLIQKKTKEVSDINDKIKIMQIEGNC